MPFETPSAALLCAPGSAEELAAGLRRLATEPELRATLARNARRRVEDELSFRRRMERMVEVYDRAYGTYGA